MINLQNLLAVIHGDGGHHTDAVGATQSIEDAIEKFHALRQELETVKAASFQACVADWMLACFGEVISRDKIERNHRFLEESLELVQSLGCTASEAHQLVDYVFNRPIGVPLQEVGGVMVTLAALCNAQQLDVNWCGQTELNRIWTKVEQIRAKQAAKPKHSPLPGDYPHVM